MILGFIGTGAIAEAMIQGFCTASQPVKSIWLSPRSVERSTRLADTYRAVEVAQVNQAVIDTADVIFLTVPPSVAVQTLQQLQFRSGQHLVNCVATLTQDQARALIPADVTLYKAIPLPPAARQIGPLSYTPYSPLMQELLQKIGTALAVEDEAQLRIFACASAQIAPFYALQATVQDWLIQKGIAEPVAAHYVRALYHSLADNAIQETAPDLHTMMDEAATSGGLNEQSLQQLTDNGWFEQTNSALDAIHQRLQNQSG
ncbi:MAG: NAD(P)-binding domain-containing protein [Pseudomonadales bacterium]|nr:NAD(P)-binding domain-containing protein [Pseudomonadales bacterium]NRA16653.1 NAD(P)-binding domain-containing protein [Oceanospirillaceae bacterium]